MPPEATLCGERITPGLCGISLGAGDSSVPWAGVFGNAQHKNWHPCRYVLSPKLSHFKARPTKIADFPLLEMLY